MKMAPECDPDDYGCLLDVYPRSAALSGRAWEARSAAEWAVLAARGGVGGASGAARGVSHARELPYSRIPGWQMCSYTQGLVDRGLDPKQINDDVMLTDVDVVKSPVVMEDWSKPPDTAAHTPIVMYSFDEFFNFVLSDSWPGRTSVRVVGGQLLDELVRTMVTMENSGKIIGQSSYVFLNNRQHNSLYDKHLEECMKKARGSRLAWNTSPSTMEDVANDAKRHSEGEDTLDVSVSIADIPPAQWIYDKILVHLIHYARPFEDSGRNIEAFSRLPRKPFMCMQHDVKKIKVPPGSELSIADRISQLEKEKIDISQLKKMLDSKQQDNQHKENTGGKGKKDKGDRDKVDKDKSDKKSEQAPENKKNATTKKNSLNVNREDIEYMVPDEEGLFFTEDPPEKSPSKRMSKLGLSGSKETLTKPSRLLSRPSISMSSRLNNITEKGPDDAKSVVSVASELHKHQRIPSIQLTVRNPPRVASVKSLISGSQSKKSSQTPSVIDSSSISKSSCHSQGSSRDMQVENNLQKLNLPYDELFVSGTYQARDENRQSISNKLKELNKTRTKNKEQKAKNLLKETMESAPFDIQDRFKTQAHKKELARIKATAPRLARRPNPLPLVPGVTDQWSAYLSEQDACDQGAATDNPAQRKVLQSLVKLQRGKQKKQAASDNHASQDSKPKPHRNKTHNARVVESHAALYVEDRDKTNNANNKTHNAPDVKHRETHQNASDVKNRNTSGHALCVHSANGRNITDMYSIEQELSSYIAAWRLHQHSRMKRPNGCNNECKTIRIINSKAYIQNNEKIESDQINEKCISRDTCDNSCLENITDEFIIFPIVEQKKNNNRINTDPNMILKPIVKSKYMKATKDMYKKVTKGNRTICSSENTSEHSFVQTRSIQNSKEINITHDVTHNNPRRQTIKKRGNLNVNKNNQVHSSVTNHLADDIKGNEERTPQPGMGMESDQNVIPDTQPVTPRDSTTSSLEHSFNEDDEDEIGRLIRYMKTNNVECPCGECDDAKSNLYDLRPIEQHFPFTYPPLLGMMGKHYEFLQHNEPEESRNLQEEENVSMNRQESLPCRFPHFRNYNFDDFLLKVMEKLVVRREIMSATNGNTYTTVTFSRPECFQKTVQI